MARRRGTNGKAIASLVLGISSLVCSLFTGIPAIIFGIKGLNDASISQGRIKGRGLAIAGIILGCISTFIILPIGLALPAIQKARHDANRKAAYINLKQLSLAMLNYGSGSSTGGNVWLPPAVVYSKDGKPLYSWRVVLLPYLNELNLYNQFHLDEPWDSPHNLPLAAQMPAVFRLPSQAGKASSQTHFQVFVGGGALFDAAEPLRPGDAEFRPPRGTHLAGPPEAPGDITDGTSNTILIVEAATAVPWSKPADLTYAPDQPLPQLGASGGFGFKAFFFNVVFVDGTVRFIPSGIDERWLRAAITRNGGEKFQVDQLVSGTEQVPNGGRSAHNRRAHK